MVLIMGYIFCRTFPLVPLAKGNYLQMTKDGSDLLVHLAIRFKMLKLKAQ